MITPEDKNRPDGQWRTDGAALNGKQNVRLIDCAAAQVRVKRSSDQDPGRLAGR